MYVTELSLTNPGIYQQEVLKAFCLLPIEIEVLLRLKLRNKAWRENFVTFSYFFKLPT